MNIVGIVTRPKLSKNAEAAKLLHCINLVNARSNNVATNRTAYTVELLRWFITLLGRRLNEIACEYPAAIIPTAKTPLIALKSPPAKSTKEDFTSFSNRCWHTFV